MPAKGRVISQACSGGEQRQRRGQRGLVQGGGREWGRTRRRLNASARGRTSSTSDVVLPAVAAASAAAAAASDALLLVLPFLLLPDDFLPARAPARAGGEWENARADEVDGADEEAARSCKGRPRREESASPGGVQRKGDRLEPTGKRRARRAAAEGLRADDMAREAGWAFGGEGQGVCGLRELGQASGLDLPSCIGLRYPWPCHPAWRPDQHPYPSPRSLAPIMSAPSASGFDEATQVHPAPPPLSSALPAAR